MATASLRIFRLLPRSSLRDVIDPSISQSQSAVIFSGTRVFDLLPESFAHFLAMLRASVSDLACANGVPETLAFPTARQPDRWNGLCIGGVVSRFRDPSSLIPQGVHL